MSPTMASLLKLALPVAGSIFLLVKFGRKEFLAQALRWPTLTAALGFLALYLGWMLATDFVVGWRGPWDFQPWRDAPIASSVLRLLAVVVAGPIFEEIVFRGVAFGLLCRTRIGPAGAILVTSAVWAAIHVDYSPTIIAILFVAGLILGLARWRSGSVYLPAIMHILWNMYAIW